MNGTFQEYLALMQARELPTELMSPDRFRYLYIQFVFKQCSENVSETARRLNLHRRTLQRKLQKNMPL